MVVERGRGRNPRPTLFVDLDFRNIPNLTLALPVLSSFSDDDPSEELILLFLSPATVVVAVPVIPCTRHNIVVVEILRLVKRDFRALFRLLLFTFALVAARHQRTTEL